MTSDVLKRAPQILAPIAVAYGQRLKEFGAKPKGVLWKNREGQLLRFEVLAGILDPGLRRQVFSVNDLGCGYAALFEFLLALPGAEVSRYHGYDISEHMVRLGRARIANPRAAFTQSLIATEKADYSFVSGTYNLHLDVKAGEWTEYVKASLAQLWTKTAKGMAFNMLSVDSANRLDGLYYADGEEFLDFSSRTLTADVTLIDDYPLDEWTILARRQAVNGSPEPASRAAK